MVPAFHKPVIDVTQKAAQFRLNDQHRHECIQTRGLDPNWIEANCRSVTSQEATQYLGYPAKSAGILLESHGLQMQFKPDRPWKKEGEKKAPKYRSPLGDYDVMLVQDPKAPDRWLNIEELKSLCYHIDGHPCLVLTEGFFKALAACSNGILTIALLGVEMGLTSTKADIQGKRYLVQTLEKFARAGFGFIIAFDADYATNSNVLWAQRRLSEQLNKFKVPVYSVSGNWSVDQGKGMDDYIQNNGADKFKRDVLGNAIAYEDWLKIQKLEGQFDQDQGKKPPSPRQLGLELAQKHQPEWAFHNEQKVWRVYNGKVWEDIEEEAFQQVVYGVIKSMGIQWDLPVYIDNTIRVLKYELLVKKWITFDRKRYIAFNNCVLDTETGFQLDHNPGFCFTSHLPYDYSIKSNCKDDPLVALQQQCPHIYEFMARAMGGSSKRILKLLAIVNGAIKFRFHDLQMFVHLVGKPGTGKGTFSRILEKVVGKVNTANSSLTALKEGTEIAAIIDKQMVIFPDERRQVGVEILLKLTGGDKVRYREIYKKRGEAYFLGLLLVLSNNPVFAGDTTGVERRLSLVQFLNPIPKHLRSSTAEQSLEAEIPSLIPLALMLKDAQVTSLIKGLGDDEIPEFKQQEWLMKMQVNSLAAWANENLIHDLDASTAVGDGRKTDSGYNTQTLYGNYRDYCEASGVKQPFQLTSFSSSLIDLCTDVLEWSGIEKMRTNAGIRIKGLRLREQPFDDDIPRIDESFAAVQGVKGRVDPSVGSQPLQNKPCVGYEGQIEQKASQTNQQTSNPLDRGVETVSEIYQEADVRSCSTEQQETEEKKEADVAFTPTQGYQDKGLEPSLKSTLAFTNPTPVVSESDYSTFPHRASDNMQAKRNLANKIKEQLLEAHSKEELTAVKEKHGENQTNWVWRNLLSEGEREKLRAIALTQQLDLLSLAPGTEAAQVVFAPGNKVLHAEFGEGIVEQQIGDTLFCRFACGKRSPCVWEVRTT
jgi:putative DNA primase/helicase